MEKKPKKSLLRRYFEANLFLFVPPFLVSTLVIGIYMLIYFTLSKIIGSYTEGDLRTFYLFIAVMIFVWIVSVALLNRLLTRWEISWINPKWGVSLFYVISFVGLTLRYTNQEGGNISIVTVRVTILILYAIISLISFYFYNKRVSTKEMERITTNANI